ncbi:GNAT family N-acetyltransferase [Caulobacter mirabilis]|nr:GNAT family N-acetyltransferase [Caulobacter mirabilis]
MTIRTTRLRLEPARLADLEAFERDGEAGLLRALDVQAVDGWAGSDALEAVGRSAAFLREHPHAAAWWMHLFFDAADGRLIGLGGYKGAPASGFVEIGYELAPSVRGRGLATEAARGMVDHAFAQPEIDHVVAHTLPEENASVAILRRLGFHLDDVVEDEDVGAVWRWRLNRA